MASNCLWQILLWAEAVNDDDHHNNVCVLFLSIPVSGIKHHQAAAAPAPAAITSRWARSVHETFLSFLLNPSFTERCIDQSHFDCWHNNALIYKD